MVPFTMLTLRNDIAIVVISRLSNSYVGTSVHVYRDEFVPMGDLSTWVRYKGAKVITNWTFRRATKGRPKSTRYLNEMDLRDMCGPLLYALCKIILH
ncbi:hypothetical protein Ahy_B10g105314 isoform B [Arachis hypogaea]|uniref:Uncharacterized protein n=1 Tax=Arachis hypogaea TaxID=3818 RepID=A0A444X7Q7_ARAHY|nr:hypothetical protein Ahy_B10g105314 isoform B [Arachis hypogaea]